MAEELKLKAFDEDGLTIISSLCQDSIIKKNEYDYDEKSKRFAIFNFLNSNSIVLDFGANIGDVSQYLNDMFNCKIYCYTTV